MAASGCVLRVLRTLKEYSGMQLFTIISRLPHNRNLPRCYYSTKKLGGKIGGKGLGPILEKKVLPVETDPEKLVTYACGTNIYKQGEDVKLKNDDEYPDWLWNLRLGKPPPLEEMDPNTLEYWLRLRKLAKRRDNALRSVRRVK